MKRGQMRRKASLKGQNQPLSASKRPRQPLRRAAAPRRQKGQMSSETRAAAMKRDGNRCRCCGRRATTVHHIWPRTRWPQLADEEDNLISANWKCHQRHETAFERFKVEVVLEQAERVIAKVKRDGDGYVPSMRSYLRRTYRRA